MPQATTWPSVRIEIMKRAIGLIELRSIARGMNTTDKMLKAANVELLRAHVVCPANTSS
jgi:microcompartment protein CcmL/EutN